MSIEKFIVSRDDSIYEAWPDLVLTEKGKLICVFAECIHHKDRSQTRIVYKESVDRGRTWGAKIPLTENTDGSYYWNCPRIMRLKDNRLVIACDKLSGINKTIKFADHVEHFCYLWFSDPEGLNWEGPSKTPASGIVPDKLLETVTGRWLLSLHEKNPVSGYLEQKLWYSDDKGQTWTGPVMLASCEGLNLCEVSMIQLHDGTLAAFLRENSGAGMDCYKAFSRDNGETWDGVYNMPLSGCHRPVAGHLKSGKVMITYRFNQGEKKTTKYKLDFINFFSALTDVDSIMQLERKEQWTRIMPVDYDRSPVPDCGYSGWVQFDDGELYIVQYIVDDAPNGQIRGYSLREEDFILNY